MEGLRVAPRVVPRAYWSFFRTGEIPEQTREQILRETDREKLRRWLKAAAKAGSVEEFCERRDIVHCIRNRQGRKKNVKKDIFIDVGGGNGFFHDRLRRNGSGKRMNSRIRNRFRRRRPALLL